MGNPVNPSPLARGDIVLVPFPFTDLTAHKVRPAVVISLDPKEDVLVAFISSVIPDHPASTEWVLPMDHPEFHVTGLKCASVIKADKLLTIHRSLILCRLGHLGPESQATLDQRLLIAVGVTHAAVVSKRQPSSPLT